MENASKAILMAGGMLLTILIVSLVIFAWSTFSSYYSQKDSIDEIDDVTEFNLQFTNYERNDVTGYELLSLTYKVIDYNTRRTTAKRENKEDYPTITLIIDMDLDESARELSSGVENASQEYKDSLKLFDKNKEIYTVSDYRNEFQYIIDTIRDIENKPESGAVNGIIYGSSNLQNMSKNIPTIYDELPIDPQQVMAQKKTVVEKVNNITSEKFPLKTDAEVEDSYQKIMNNETRVRQYYEYIQFKKATFSSVSIAYDDQYDITTGRIVKLHFKYKKN